MSAGEADIALVDPRVPERVVQHQADREVTGRRLSEQLPLVVRELFDRVDQRVAGRVEGAERLGRGM